ncbi:N-formylglutamate amidohydrolase [Modestobacter sp. SYSU DS0875]
MPSVSRQHRSCGTAPSSCARRPSRVPPGECWHDRRVAMAGGDVTTLHSSEPAAVLLSVPHGGRHVPQVYTEGLRLPPETLWSDWYTAELFDLSDQLSVPTVLTRLSRFVADANRALAPPLHGDFWSTAVPARDPAGVPLYDRELTNEDLQARLDMAHGPYHQALDRAVNAALQQHRRVLLLDLHSFGLPLGVDVVLGDGNGRTASADASDRVERALRQAGLTIARNVRFTGGYIVERWADDERVDAVQIELNQRRYLRISDVEENRPSPPRDPAGWAETRRAMTAAVRSLVAPRR